MCFALFFFSFFLLLSSRSSLPWINLLHVDLCQNYLTDRGASVIGNNMLPHCEHLHTLLLSDCFIHDIGFMSIMKAIWSKETERRGRRHDGMSGDGMSDGTNVVDGLIGSLVESKEEVGIERVEGVVKSDVKSDAACKPRRWRLVDLSTNGVTDQGLREFRAYMLKGRKQYQKMKRIDHQQRKRREKRSGKGRRKEKEAAISTRFRDNEKEEEECLDAYRSHVIEMRLCDNAITMTGARDFGASVVESGAFVKRLSLESYLDRARVIGHVNVCNVMYDTQVNMVRRREKKGGGRKNCGKLDIFLFSEFFLM